MASILKKVTVWFFAHMKNTLKNTLEKMLPSLFPKICYIYPAMMKLGKVILYLKKTQKAYESRDTALVLCWHQHSSIEN